VDGLSFSDTFATSSFEPKESKEFPRRRVKFDANVMALAESEEDAIVVGCLFGLFVCFLKCVGEYSVM